jgi:glycine cleavage system H protein
VAGEIVAINEELEDSPEKVNTDAYGDGWLFRIKLEDASELDDLLDAEGYESSIDED